MSTVIVGRLTMYQLVKNPSTGFTAIVVTRVTTKNVFALYPKQKDQNVTVKNLVV